LSTEYYVYGDTLLPNTVARSSDVKAEFQAIETGLAKLPTPAELKLGTTQYGTAGGVADAYTVALPYTPAAYTTGMMVAFKAGAQNTGAATVNVNGLGVKSIKRPDGTALQAGDITTTAVTLLFYNGTDFIIGNSLPSIVSAAAASASAAAVSAAAALASEGDAQTAQAAAELAQAAAEAAQLAAETAETNAETAETNAGTAATNAGLAQTAAEAAQLGAETAQGLAEAAQLAAETAQGLAEAAKAAAETAETNAETAETNAEAAQTAAEAAYDAFDDRYLGSKAADPTLDNDGNALLTGALYWNSVASEMRVYNGAAWVAAYVPAATYLPLAGGTVTGATEFQNDLNVTGTLKIASTAVTSSAAELNVLDGIPGTLTATELGYVDGVTSAIQTQLNARVLDTGDTMTGDLAMSNNDISDVKTVGFYAEYDNGNSGTADTITLTNGQKQKSTLTGNATLTISATSAPPGHYQLRLIQDATGGRSVTWSGISSTQWLNSASAPSINTAANGQTIINIFVSATGTITCASAAKVGAA
jgi:hypothetical protein